MESFFDKVKMPPSAELLGWELISLDPEAREIEVAFEGKPIFANPTGHVQGGILAAMIDDAISPIVVVATKGECLAPTIDLHVQFLRPTPMGRITVKGKATRIGKSVAFLEGELFDKDGNLCARGTASGSIVKLR